MASTMTRGALALCALLGGCDRVGDSISKNWTGKWDPEEFAPAPGQPIAGSAAPTQSTDGTFYAFASTLRGAQQAACSSVRFDLGLSFAKDMRTATAHVIQEPWACGPLDFDGSVYYLGCDSPAGSATRGSLVLAIDRLPPTSHINGEASLAISTAAFGTCEQDYALSGDLR